MSKNSCFRSIEPHVERLTFPSLINPSNVREELPDWIFVFEKPTPKLENEISPSLKTRGMGFPFCRSEASLRENSPS